MSINFEMKCRTELTDDGLVRFRAWISEADNAPAEVFLMKALPTAPDGDMPEEIFVKLCSYSDVFNYGTSDDDVRRHFRIGHIDLLFDNLQDANAFQDELSTALQSLADDIIDTNAATPVAVTSTIS